MKVDTRFSLVVEVWDEDSHYDDLLIRCKTVMTKGSYAFTCRSGTQGFEAKYTLTCDPYLTGDKCDRYEPSPQ